MVSQHAGSRRRDNVLRAGSFLGLSGRNPSMALSATGEGTTRPCINRELTQLPRFYLVRITRSFLISSSTSKSPINEEFFQRTGKSPNRKGSSQYPLRR